MELENYITSMEGKAKNTIRTYVSNYNRLRKHFDKDITDIPNMELIEHISAQESSNTKNGFITVAIQVKRMNDRDITDLTDYRETLKISLVTEIKKKNAALQEVLPDYSNLGLRVARDAIKYFPDSISVWELLRSFPGITPQEDELSKREITRLDPIPHSK
jgi:hypothetical protein